MKRETGERFLTQALAHVESESIRKWATTDHNRPLWVKMAKEAAQKGYDPKRFATYIVCVAIGA